MVLTRFFFKLKRTLFLRSFFSAERDLGEFPFIVGVVVVPRDGGVCSARCPVWLSTSPRRGASFLVFFFFRFFANSLMSWTFEVSFFDIFDVSFISSDWLLSAAFSKTEDALYRDSLLVDLVSLFAPAMGKNGCSSDIYPQGC